MSNEMIERVAVVIYNEVKLNRANKPSLLDKNSDPSLKLLYWYKIAKAAIQAMQEPTEEMKSYYMFHELKCWQEMIDAALKED